MSAAAQRPMSREAVAQILARFHRNACYPEAMDAELFAFADQILALTSTQAPPQTQPGLETFKLTYIKRWRTLVNLPAEYAAEIVEALREPAQCAPDVTQAMALAGARSIGNTIHATNHVVRARECWRAMWAAKDGEVEPTPTGLAVTSAERVYFGTDLAALAVRIIGIQEDLPDEDDRNALGEAAHYLRKAAALTSTDSAVQPHNYEPDHQMMGHCRKCGLPQSEHHYNGAAYGVCGDYTDGA